MADDAASLSSFAAFPSKKYDVFISFRGEETRSNFTSHLHTALCQKQIQTYIDYRLHKGQEISEALIQAIQDSYVSIMVFSENYASSIWCLDELTKILQCKKAQGQVVIPVFYKVDPSHVRKQTGTYKQAFEKHERDFKHNKDKVHKWKAALTEAANLAGWDSLTFRDESKLIQKIVKDVLRKLDYRHPPTELKGLVGIDNNRAQIELLLRKVQTIGIHGMGGIGKTTIARAIFAKYSSQYEGCCFLANVRENSGKHGNGLYGLRNKLIAQLLEEEDQHIGTATAESTFLKCRLNRKKVLVVLDDVSTSEQLEYLVGELRFFGPRSKIIITTRDKHVLSKGVDEIYKVEELNFQESLQLFSLNAFNQSLPIMGYEELSNRAVFYAKGIPLALKVLGSFLHAKCENEWDSALRKLEKIPNEEIQNVLRLSYDGLNHEERQIFLDIACLLKGKDKEQVISLLDNYGFYASIGLRTLQDKALIIVDYKLIWMHDLIQEMGWEIVRQESIKEPGRRSRLWDTEEVYDALTNNKGTDAIEGIILDMSQIRDVHLSVDTFKNMTNLRFLKFFCPDDERSCHMHLQKGLKSFPNKISYLEWYGYPLKFLPSTFCPEKLVELHLPHSRVKKLWDGVQDLVNLKEIDLTSSKKLMELPDFSKALNLSSVDFCDCKRLRHVHPSILSLNSLVTLILTGCRKLESLQSEIHLRSLKYISVDDCSNLKEFSVSSEEIRMLDLRNTGIRILHSSIGRSSKLKELYLGGLRLKNLPDELSCLRSLTELGLSNCEIIDKTKLLILFDDLCSLKGLFLDNCCNLTEFPNNTKHLTLLERLFLRNCKRLRSLPKLPPSIVELDASNCTSLKTVFTFMSSRLLKGDDKFISFQNCMKLDEQSLLSIIEDARSSMMRAAYGPELARRFKDKFIRRNRSEFCLPGSRVPEWFRYRTREASITIELPPPSHLLGFVFCVVSHFFSMGRSYSDNICCQCYLGDFMNVGQTSSGYYRVIPEMNRDQVHLWYHPWECDEILKGIEGRRGNDQLVTVSFKFSTRSYKHGFTDLKECGVCPIYVSGYYNFIGQMSFKSKLEWELGTNTKRPRNVDERELLPEFKKLKLELATQSNTCLDIEELEVLLTRMNIT